MKKSKRKTAKASKRPANSPEPNLAPTRRQMLRLGTAVGLVSVGVTGAGLWAASSFRAHAAEHDLTRIGQGRPAVVQIHDPTCAMCTDLQRQTRRALRCNFADEPIYLVASIRTDEGAAFSASHGVPHVTLMIMDGAGAVQDVLSGVRPRAELKSIFEGHFGRATA